MVPLVTAVAPMAIDALAAAVNRPSAPTVNVATLDADPYDAAVTPVVPTEDGVVATHADPLHVIVCPLLAPLCVSADSGWV